METAIRALARTMRDRADAVRVVADRMVGHAEQLRWRGAAADACRARVRECALDLRDTATLHDDAAAALDRHARAVEAALEAALVEGRR